MNADEVIHTLTADIEDTGHVDERLLLWLLKHPMQRREDIALALRLHPSSVYRHLTGALADGLVEYVKPALGPTNSAPWYYLTTHGICAAAALVGADPTKLARMWGANEASLLRLLPRLSGLGRLQTLVNGLVAYAPTIQMYPGGHPATIRWHWLRDYQVTFHTRGKTARCTLDAALVWSRHQRPRTIRESAYEEASFEEPKEYYGVFVLLDDGLVGSRDLTLMRGRLERLLRYRESAERWSHYRAFPTLLVLTTSLRNREHWQRCAREVAAHLRLDQFKGAIVALDTSIPITSAWVLSWQSLIAPIPCRLQDMLIPLSREAVPEGLLAPRSTPAGTFAPGTSQARMKIVTGQLTERARHLLVPLPGAPGPGQQCYETTTTCLLSLHLSHRHQILLQELYAHPLLTVLELAVFVGMEPSTVTRYLADLKPWIEIVETPRGRRLCLSERGLQVQALRLHVSLQHLLEEGKQRGRSSLHALIRHTAGLYRFLAQLHQSATGQHHRVLWWETGAWCARRYRSQGTWHHLFPDAALAYQTGARVIHAWIEWDEGSMKARDLATKLHAYAHFVAAREWIQEGPTLPALLCIVPDPAQERRLVQLARDLLPGTPLEAYSTTVTRLLEQGPLAAIWLPILFETPYAVAQRRKWVEIKGER